MLTHLSISNFALIDSLEVDFEKGLSILTGESVSWKSIIIEALEMLLGERADLKALKNPEAKCIIEGEFLISSYGLNDFFRQHEIDYSDTTIFRREINPQGKSRSFVNDTPVNLNVLKELGAFLVNVHSQHETLDIGKSVNQFEFLDAYCGNQSELEDYRKEFKNWHALGLEIEQLTEQEKRSKLDLDYFTFQLEELNTAQLKQGELESSEEELATAEHAEEIRLSVDKATQLMADEQQGIMVRIRELKQILGKTAAFNRSLETTGNRLESVYAELQDIEGELERIAEDVIIDPQRSKLLRERVDHLNNLLFKHRVRTIEELMALRDEIEAKVAAIGSLDEQIAQKQKERSLLEEKLNKNAARLGVRRRKEIPSLEKEMNSLFQSLAMPHAELKIEISESSLNTNGNDALRFLIRTNKGASFSELPKVASGGEFSRIMLALKSIFARVKTLPTIIFDEIDTGVSGEVAHKMGEIMKKMGQSMQVFSITHLPQVAVKGNAHYKVYKETGKQSTQTKMQRLSDQQRLEEVARMLSGDKLSDAALANARELMMA